MYSLQYAIILKRCTRHLVCPFPIQIRFCRPYSVLFCTFPSSSVLVLPIFIFIRSCLYFFVLFGPCVAHFHPTRSLFCPFPSFVVLVCPCLYLSVLVCPCVAHLHSYQSLSVLVRPYVVLVCPCLSLSFLIRPCLCCSSLCFKTTGCLPQDCTCTYLRQKCLKTRLQLWGIRGNAPPCN